MIAIREAWGAGLFKRVHWLPNILAGIIVGIVSLPLCIAFAIASGARPEQGLYTGIVAGLCVSVFGGSRLQIAGPTGAFVIILSGVTAEFGIAGLQIATFMAGIMMLLFGVARLGTVIKFIPDPVIVGFTAGIGIIVWVGQWSYFFGLQAVAADKFHEKFWHLLQALPKLHLATTLLSLGTLMILLLVPRIYIIKRLPSPIVAVVMAAVVQYYFQFDGVATLGSSFGSIPAGLPLPQIPHVSFSKIIDLMAPAFAIAMLGSIESLMSAVVADDMAGTKHNSNQELIGQGIANIIVPLFGGFAATGAIARTATNVRSGATSPLAGITCAVVMIVVVVFLTSLVAHIPLCALAAVLFVVAYNLADLNHVVRIIKKAPRSDAAILLTTLVLTVFVDLVVAVNVGVILATLDFMRRMSLSVEVLQEHNEVKKVGKRRAIPRSVAEKVLTFTIEGPFFFGAVERFEKALIATHTEPKFVILRFKNVPFADITGIQTLEELIEDLAKRGVVLVFCEVNHTLKGQLHKAGVVDLLGEDRFYNDYVAALAYCSQGLS